MFFANKRRLPHVIAAILASLTALGAPAQSAPYQPDIAPASDEGQRAIAAFTAAPGFEIELFAAEPQLANPVAFYVDYQGNFYVAETYRHHKGVGDMRGHREWLVDDLASRTVEDRLVAMKKNLGADFANWVGEHDRIKVLGDADGDGKADWDKVYADGFKDALAGIGAGVLLDRGNLYYTCIPELWRLRDNDGDHVADEREVLSTGYGVHINFLGHDLHGLRKGPDGRLYFSIGDRGVNTPMPDGSRLEDQDTGAVFRCNLDGSRLEIVHRGLRNPQELAFDNYGNLFTGDNNSDAGDQARWVWIVEGGDSGWRIGYQWITQPNTRGPWNAEKMWEPLHAGQPAHIVPPILNLGAGPSGLAFYPGTGMSDAYNDTFFLCDFRGDKDRSLIHAFQVAPKGASFELVNRRDFSNHMLATDVEFGMRPGLYFSDWTQGWDQPMKGRLYRVFEPAQENNATHAEAVRLLREGMAHRTPGELAGLLGHADQRVRLEAQWALADLHEAALPIFDAAANAGATLFARLHGIWGQWQLLLQGDIDGATLLPLLSDASEEVRLQAARVLAEASPGQVVAALHEALNDPSPRVQFHAATSLGRLGVKDPAATAALVDLLRRNDNKDAYLRHAAVIGLRGTAEEAALAALAYDPTPAVRLGALLTLRRLKSPETARFLTDSDAFIVAEAVRAIHDAPIEAAYPALAALADTGARIAEGDAYTWRRVLNAHWRLGRANDAAALARLATHAGIPEGARVEALVRLADWTEPPALDPVTGAWWPRPAGSADDVRTAIATALDTLVRAPEPAVLLAVAAVCERHQIEGAGPALARLVANTEAAPEDRVEAMRALGRIDAAALRPLLDTTLHADSDAIRAESLTQLVALDSAAASAAIRARLEEGSVPEKQAALRAIPRLDMASQADLLVGLLKKLVRNETDPAIQLELVEVAGASTHEPVRDAFADYHASLSTSDPLAPYRPALAGGDRRAGRAIFFERAETQCLRCHAVDGEGGSEVGPDLTGIGARVDREHLLAAIVTPNAAIAEGFENVAITRRDGSYLTGRLLAEDDATLTLEVPKEEDPFADLDGPELPHSEVDVVAEDSAHGDAATLAPPNVERVTIPKSDILTRDRALSSMPEGLANFLTLSELRDLVEFLATRN
ncbi:MAG: HEAT repeat domain-containing protein [Candidatus Hydrogenedentes bacterium]|nr:HEAT repeat domain-containing protein [Candidatus Hydrogenedentota bacterium]